MLITALPNRIFRKLILLFFTFGLFLWLSYFALVSTAGTFHISDSENLDLINSTEKLSTVAVIIDPRKIQHLRKLAGNRNQRAVEKIRVLARARTFRYVIAVQVHDRITYIKALIESLAGTRNIEDALVIFSHDVIDEGIDLLVANAEANFEIVQIYFPFSIQLFPQEFPGPSPADCPDRVGLQEATKRRCINHNHPDSYGNYRTPRLCQVKHHWWWKFQFVFSQVAYLSKNISVLFVEEDHYLLPDALMVLDQLNELRLTVCEPRCPVISIAHHKIKLAESSNAYEQFGVGQWIGSRDNIGLVFDYDQYKAISECSETFCSVDDYNWDWSLYFMLKNCLKKEFPMLLPIAPRVLHIGDCGGIHHKTSCNPQKSVRKATEAVQAAQRKLFPVKLVRSSQKFPKHKDSKVNGGWGDPRDVNLCRNVTSLFST